LRRSIQQKRKPWRVAHLTFVGARTFLSAFGALALTGMKRRTRMSALQKHTGCQCSTKVSARVPVVPSDQELPLRLMPVRENCFSPDLKSVLITEHGESKQAGVKTHVW